jgi:hypothetical protein
MIGESATLDLSDIDLQEIKKGSKIILNLKNYVF